MSGYIFAHFTMENIGGEQVYFAASKDGLIWQDLYGDKPALVSDLGDKGVRDPFLVQHPETKKYYLMATDLCMLRREYDWEGAVVHGSRDLIFWESDDLITWNGPWNATVAPVGAGCAWAPEAVWDEEKQAFMVFFACKTTENGENKHRIYRVYTTDFRTFTAPEKYIERDRSVIDTTIVRHNGMYYRFSKNESTARIVLDRGSDLSGEFQAMDTPVLSAIPGLEGPECYQLPDGKWCLICDQYQAKKGYLPIVIDDMEKGEMHILKDGEYDFAGVLKRHGGVLKIDDAAYENLIKSAK